MGWTGPGRSRRLWEDKREASREIEVGPTPVLSLVDTVRPTVGAELGVEDTPRRAFREALPLCSLPRTACLIAWWFVVPERFLRADSITCGLFESLMRSVAAGAQPLRRPKSAVFP